MRLIYGREALFGLGYVYVFDNSTLVKGLNLK